MITMGRTARWAVTVLAAGTMMIGGAGAAFAGDWEQAGYTGWTPWSASTYATPDAVDRVSDALARVTSTTRYEDEPGWSCATDGNRVCGPGHGPNATDHNVYYGTGELPFIPGRVTTRADGSQDGPRCMDSVFAELGHAVPAGTTVGDCD